MLPNLGISTSYFAAKGFSICDSVKRAYVLGFRVIELGANHSYEPGLDKIVNKIRQDFPDVTFTQHCYFPPVFAKEYFANPAEGLTYKNKKVIDSMFEAAKIIKPAIVSFHSGLNTKFTYKGMFKQWQGFKEFSPTEPINQDQAMKNLGEFVDYALKKAKPLGIKVAMENIVGRPEYATTLTDFTQFQRFLNKYPKLNFLFDYGHGFIVHREKGKEFFNFQEKIIEMHLCDVTSEFHDHRVLGKGILDLRKLFTEIKNLPKMPILILEHSAEVKEEEILSEIKLVENYLIKKGDN